MSVDYQTLGLHLVDAVAAAAVEEEEGVGLTH